MKVAANRVLLALQDWEERKKEMGPLLKAGMTDATTLLKLQLQHLRQATTRLAISARPDERPFLALLANHISKLEKQLYPQLLARIFYHLKYRFIDGPAYLQKQAEQRVHNMEQLKTQLREAGLHAVNGKLDDHLDPEQRHICMPLDSQLPNDKQLKFDLHFEKDAYDNFQLDRIDTALYHQENLQRQHTFELSDWPDLKAIQVMHLLEGRAMRQTFINASGHQEQRWVELGEKALRHYDPAYEFDIKALLATYPAIGSSKPELIRYLENGQRAPAFWKVDRALQNITIHADPTNRSLKFFDAKNRAITPEQLNQNAEKRGPLVRFLGEPVQKPRKIVKNGHHI